MIIKFRNIYIKENNNFTNKFNSVKFIIQAIHSVLIHQINNTIENLEIISERPLGQVITMTLEYKDIFFYFSHSVEQDSIYNRIKVRINFINYNESTLKEILNLLKYVDYDLL